MTLPRRKGYSSRQLAAAPQQTSLAVPSSAIPSRPYSPRNTASTSSSFTDISKQQHEEQNGYDERNTPSTAFSRSPNETEINKETSREMFDIPETAAAEGLDVMMEVDVLGAVPDMPEAGLDPEITEKANELRSHLLFPWSTTIMRKYSIFASPGIRPTPYLQLEELDFGLEDFFRIQGIELNTLHNSNEGFAPKVRDLITRYNAELTKLNRLCEIYIGKILLVLREQDTIRSVCSQEVQLRLAVIKRQFDRVRTQLKQNICAAILQLQKHYGQTAGDDKKGAKRRLLPKFATQVLNDWFFAHLHDPYPSDEEKAMLATKAGITLSQTNNWFGNKRIRYKKKCVEMTKKRQREDDPAGHTSNLPSADSLCLMHDDSLYNTSTSPNPPEYTPPAKRLKNEGN